MLAGGAVDDFLTILIENCQIIASSDVFKSELRIRPKTLFFYQSTNGEAVGSRVKIQSCCSLRAPSSVVTAPTTLACDMLYYTL